MSNVGFYHMGDICVIIRCGKNRQILQDTFDLFLLKTQSLQSSLGTVLIIVGLLSC